MTALRGVGPMKLCDAGSWEAYASVSTTSPPTSSTRRAQPIRSPATLSGGRAKNDDANIPTRASGPFTSGPIGEGCGSETTRVAVNGEVAHVIDSARPEGPLRPRDPAKVRQSP